MSFSVATPSIAPMRSMSKVACAVSSGVPVLHTYLSSSRTSVVHAKLERKYMLVYRSSTKCGFMCKAPRRPLRKALARGVKGGGASLSFCSLGLATGSTRPRLAPSKFWHPSPLLCVTMSLRVGLGTVDRRHIVLSSRALGHCKC